MLKKHKMNRVSLGMFFAIGMALLCIALTWMVFYDKQAYARMKLYFSIVVWTGWAR